MPMPRSIVVTLPNGEQEEMYYISVLAEALGRQSQVIRKWEISGIIPPTFYRDEHNNRLYTQEQIDCVVESAEKYKIKSGVSLTKSAFSKSLYRGFKVLYEKYKERLKV